MHQITHALSSVRTTFVNAENEPCGDHHLHFHLVIFHIILLTACFSSREKTNRIQTAHLAYNHWDFSTFSSSGLHCALRLRISFCVCVLDRCKQIVSCTVLIRATQKYEHHAIIMPREKPLWPRSFCDDGNDDGIL